MADVARLYYTVATKKLSQNKRPTHSPTLVSNKVAVTFADATARPVVDQLKINPSRQSIEQLQQIMTNAYDNLPERLGKNEKLFSCLHFLHISFVYAKTIFVNYKYEYIC